MKTHICVEYIGENPVWVQFINTTDRYFGQKCMMIFSSMELWQSVCKISFRYINSYLEGGTFVVLFISWSKNYQKSSV